MNPRGDEEADRVHDDPAQKSRTPVLGAGTAVTDPQAWVSLTVENNYQQQATKTESSLVFVLSRG